MSNKLELIAAENQKLKKALAALIPWAGHPADGPSWATPEAKARNKAMCDEAIADACACFPADYNECQEIVKAN